jgi:hypothetical protein
MIISHTHEFIFVAVPKTGTHSIRRALRAQMGPEDHEQVGLFVRSQLPYPELAAFRHGHLSLSQVRPHVGEHVFGRYFKFAFVRNPFDRFVSYCAFMTRQSDAFETNPRGVMAHVLEHPPKDHILFAPQHHFLTGDDGALLTDAVGRVEDMQRSFDSICDRLGIAKQVLERANASHHGDYRDYYDAALKKGVARLYQKDIDLFEYTF